MGATGRDAKEGGVDIKLGDAVVAFKLSPGSESLWLLPLRGAFPT